MAGLVPRRRQVAPPSRRLHTDHGGRVATAGGGVIEGQTHSSRFVCFKATAAPPTIPFVPVCDFTQVRLSGKLATVWTTGRLESRIPEAGGRNS